MSKPEIIDNNYKEGVLYFAANNMEHIKADLIFIYGLPSLQKINFINDANKFENKVLDYSRHLGNIEHIIFQLLIYAKNLSNENKKLKKELIKNLNDKRKQVNESPCDVEKHREE